MEIDEIYGDITEKDVDLINDMLVSDLSVAVSNHDISKHFSSWKIPDMSALSNLIRLINDVIEMGFDSSDERMPFKAAFNINGKRSLALEDLSIKIVSIIEHVQTRTTIPLLKAIFSDIVWLKKKKIDFAWSAIVHYCETVSSVSAQCPENLSYFVQYLKRAATLAQKLNAPDEIRSKVRETYVAAMKLELAEPPSALRLLYFEDYIGTRIFNFNESQQLLALAQKLAQDSIIHDFEKVRGYLECAKKLASILKDRETLNTIREKYAWSYVDELEYHKKLGAVPMILQDYYIRAITALKRIEAPVAKINALHAELSAIQPDISDSFGEIGYTMDISETISQISLDAEKYSDNELLTFIGKLTFPLSKSKLTQDSERIIKCTPLLYMIGRVTLGSQGNVMYRSRGDDESADSSALEIALFDQLAVHIEITGSIISTMLMREWANRIEDRAIWRLVSVNPLIPIAKRDLVYRGLKHGLRFDFASAVHMLVPQLEDILRGILRSQGEIVGFLKTDKTEQQIDMNEILRNEKAKLLLGENWQFLLKSLFVDPGSLNFRNRLAHGLIDSEESSGSSAVFIWANTILILMMAASGLPPFCPYKEPQA